MKRKLTIGDYDRLWWIFWTLESDARDNNKPDLATIYRWECLEASGNSLRAAGMIK